MLGSEVWGTIEEIEGTKSDADHCGSKLSAVLMLRSTVGVGEAASAGPSAFVKSYASLRLSAEVPWLFARL
jgi:hypothetical protein